MRNAILLAAAGALLLLATPVAVAEDDGPIYLCDNLADPFDEPWPECCPPQYPPPLSCLPYLRLE